MRRTVNVLFIAAAGIAASTAQARAQVQQTQPAAAPQQRVEPQTTAAQQQQQTVRLQATVAGEPRFQVEARTTTGRPYAAEAVTDTTQVLADGNRIERQTITRVFRDGEGRTRREQVTDGRIRSVSVSDPVTHTSFTLDPDKKVAYRSDTTIVMPSGIAPAGAGGGGGRGGGVGRVVGVARPAGAAAGGGGGTGSGTGAGAGVGSGTGGGQAVAGGFGGRIGGVPGGMVTVVEPGQAQKREDLGQQNIEGVTARGTRTTTTIPAGSIGNVQDIRIVSEQWFSDELQVLVMTKHSDPRSGETTYRLRNVVRAEPDPSLFTVPADYTVQQRVVRRPQ